MKHSIITKTLAPALEELHDCIMGDYECDPISADEKWWMLYGIASVACALFNSNYNQDLSHDDMFEFLDSLELPSSEDEIDEMISMILED